MVQCFAENSQFQKNKLKCREELGDMVKVGVTTVTTITTVTTVTIVNIVTIVTNVTDVTVVTDVTIDAMSLSSQMSPVLCFRP